MNRSLLLYKNVEFQCMSAIYYMISKSSLRSEPKENKPYDKNGTYTLLYAYIVKI